MRCALLLVLLAAAASGCEAGHIGLAPASDEPDVLRECTAASVKLVVSRFVDAFNDGDKDRLDALFAREGFRWYSTDGPGERLDPVARDRSTLLAYFSRRHVAGERLRLRALRFLGNSSDGYGGFQYRLIRSARGFAPRLYRGKGAAICRSRSTRIAVWAMARQPAG